MSSHLTVIEQLLAEYRHRVGSGMLTAVAALFRPEAAHQPRFDGGQEVRGRRSKGGTDMTNVRSRRSSAT